MPTFARLFEETVTPLQELEAQMAESVDALVSNTSRFTPVPVRPRLWVRKSNKIKQKPLPQRCERGFLLQNTQNCADMFDFWDTVWDTTFGKVLYLQQQLPNLLLWLSHFS